MCVKQVAVLFLSAVAVFPPAVRAQDQFVVESAREIPLAYDVDVVVVGGSSAGVAAAVKAAEDSASVFLLSSRPYSCPASCVEHKVEVESVTTRSARW